jgi:ribosome-associated protein
MDRARRGPDALKIDLSEGSLTNKKRSDDDAEQAPKPKKTAKKVAKPATKTAKPRIHASHAEGKAPLRRARPATAGGKLAPAPKAARGPAVRKAPLAGPKRTTPRRSVTPPAMPEASSAARELALALAGAAIDKKALGIEILDVTGKVDYADFLLVMTGRSDRHVHAIATGIEEEMRRRKVLPLSMEGLTSATWVLIDFGDVVVHVFQEEARALYDIEGLWIDAGRVPVPDADKVEGGGAQAPSAPSAPLRD